MAEPLKQTLTIETEFAIGHEVYLEREVDEPGVMAFQQRLAPPKTEDEAQKSWLDARYSRSYIFVPFHDQGEAPQDESGVLTSKNNVVERVRSIIDREGITDLIVMSHGWHRNLFSAMAAYDRLSAIFLDLQARGRLAPLREEFRPLLIGVHYHSDPGKDEWLDFSGRRDLASFLRNVASKIVTRGESDINLTSDFEQVFEFFARLAAPGVDVTQAGITERSLDVGEILLGYALINKPGASVTDVLTVAWACYHEADIVTQTVEQSSDAGRFVSLREWSATLATLVLAIAASASGLLTPLKDVVLAFLSDLFSPEVYGSWLQSALPFTKPFIGVLWPVLVAFAIWTIFWICLKLVVVVQRPEADLGQSDINEKFLSRKNRQKRQHSGTRFFGTLFYLPLQLVHIAPVIVWCLLTPFVATWPGVLAASFSVGLVSHVRVGEPTYTLVASGIAFAIAASILVFSRTGYLTERIKFTSQGGSATETKINSSGLAGVVRSALADFADRPIRTAKLISRPEQTWVGVWQTVENLLAFWSMANKATNVGAHVGEFVESVSLTDGKSPRVHFVGHSHGGLVVCNAASFLCRKWINKAQASQQDAVDLQSVTTINGAYRSDWFDGQTHVTKGLKGCIASLYSRYDTANKLWYPLANIGRKSAGSVGLWVKEGASLIADTLPSVTVTDAEWYENDEPDLVSRIRAVTTTAPEKAKLLNIDASRFVFKGPYLPQGAHGEIYSKDVVASIWRVMMFSEWRRGVQDAQGP